MFKTRYCRKWVSVMLFVLRDYIEKYQTSKYGRVNRGVFASILKRRALRRRDIMIRVNGEEEGSGDLFRAG